jgi:hypothetical protein
MGRCFRGMDVIVIGTKVVRIAPQHRFEHGKDFFRAVGGTTIEAPKFPRVEIHQALRIECPHI